MIVFPLFLILNKLAFVHNLKKLDELTITGRYNLYTGEVLEYPKSGKDYNLDIRITNNNAYIKGSMHKYYNACTENSCHNYNDYTYNDWVLTRSFLCQEFSTDPKETKVTNLEFGINIITKEDPQKIIDNHLLMFGYKAPSKNLKYSGKGDYKEFQTSDYSMKIYNKSKQYGLGYNVLRVELKIVNSRYLKKLGISNIENLNKEAFHRLFAKFLDNYCKLMIVDNYSNLNIPKTDLDKLNKYTNPNYWINLKTKVSPSTIANRKKEFVRIGEKYNLFTLRDTIGYKLGLKFIELMSLDNEQDAA